MARVPASGAPRKRLKDMFEGEQAVERSTLMRKAVRLILEEALEAEVAEELGRGYNDRGEQPDGHRNGYRLGRLDSAEGRIEHAVPQVRGLEGWRSEVRAALGGKTKELERLTIEMYARGLSMREIEAAFGDEHGRSVLTRSAASRVAERVWEDYQDFANRYLSGKRGPVTLVKRMSGPRSRAARTGAAHHRTLLTKVQQAGDLIDAIAAGVPAASQ